MNVLFRNQVNIPIEAMVQVLTNCNIYEYRVQLFGMNWRLPFAKPKIDQLIQNYNTQIVNEVHRNLNQFDIAFVHDSLFVHFLKFSNDQYARRQFRKGHVHLMCNTLDFGSVDFNPLFNEFGKVKIYQEICYKILSVISKDNLDDMPKTILTIYTKVRQLETLFNNWNCMDEATQYLRLLETRVEVTIFEQNLISNACVLSTSSTCAFNFKFYFNIKFYF
jgi:hypothetical protein